MNRFDLTLVLASQSPRRRELLAEAGYQFTIITPDQKVEQRLCSGCTPEELVAEWALSKALDVLPQSNADYILAADTVAEIDGQILGKPRDEADAERMLRMLSGRRHRVLTGVCLFDVRRHLWLQKVEVSVLCMRPLTEEQLADYLASDGWMEKAGAFGYQDGPDWLCLEQGLASNVVGLPVEQLPEWFAELAELNPDN
ncbi:MAG: septum formation protein Maf [Pirellulaceae bacterium]|nr:septum formation protein Maf [Pirellulaceae bacterium]